MARIPLGEKLKKRQINIDDEIEKLQYFLRSSSFRENDAKLLFNFLEDKMGCITHREFVMLLDSLVDNSSQLNKYLDYCDFFLIFFIAYALYTKQHRFANSIINDFDSVFQSITFVLNRLDYNIIEGEDGKPFIALKDAVAEEVSGMPAYSDIKWRVLEYNVYNATLTDKKAVIGELYKKFEEIRPSLKKSSKDLENKLGDLIQCVRHKKDQNRAIRFPFYYADEEKWCDRIYDLLLECFLHEENRKILNELNKDHIPYESDHYSDTSKGTKREG